MNVMSLFNGISCGHEALEKAGIKVGKYYASEIDKYANAIARKNFPDEIHLGDVTKIDFSQFVGKIDLLIGGSPCQDLSICKQNREGLQGSRSSLFYKFVEALNIIKPKYFLFENVASMTQENKDIISNLLGAEPIMINSSLVSGQHRKRLYWTNIPNVTLPEDKHIVVQDILESGLAYQEKSYAITAKYSGACFEHDFKQRKKTFVAEPTERTDKPFRLGEIGRGGQGYRVYSVKGKSICLAANGGG